MYEQHKTSATAFQGAAAKHAAGFCCWFVATMLTGRDCPCNMRAVALLDLCLRLYQLPGKLGSLSNFGGGGPELVAAACVGLGRAGCQVISLGKACLCRQGSGRHSRMRL
jgi:hypothetical protein